MSFGKTQNMINWWKWHGNMDEHLYQEIIDRKNGKPKPEAKKPVKMITRFLNAWKN